MRVLVCGGRDYFDTERFRNEMNYYHYERDFTMVIQGGAKGADFMARMWAVNNGIECKQFDADWQQHGKAAGSIRNQKMIDEGKPKLVIAFPGGRGTADMMRRAKRQNIEVILIEE